MARDSSQLAGLKGFLEDCIRYSQAATPEDLTRALKRAVGSNDVFAVIEQRRSAGGGAASSSEPRPRSITFTPSQLFKGGARMAGRIGASAPVWPRLPAEDGIAIWLANPGDVLPDGTIATPLGDAQPFEYTSDAVSGDVEELAGGEGTPGNNQAQNKQFRAVVKTLGLDQDQAQELHQEISKQGLGYHEIMERAKDMFGDGSD